MNRTEWFPTFSNFDRLFDDGWRTSAAVATTATLTMPATIEETDTHYTLALDVPGIRKDDIKIEVVDDTVKISGEKTPTTTDKKKVVHFAERRYGRFERTFRFGDDANLDSIEAQVTDGVLHLAIPKKESAKPRRIEVKVG